MPFPMQKNMPALSCGKLRASFLTVNLAYFQKWLTKVERQKRSMPLLDVPRWYAQ
jgi:hypothetical protein